MLLDDKKIQFLEGAESEWIDFDSEQHGAVIFQDNDAKFRLRPIEKVYYYARFTGGSRTEMADSQDKAEIIAKELDKGEFVIERMVVVMDMPNFKPVASYGKELHVGGIGRVEGVLREFKL